MDVSRVLPTATLTIIVITAMLSGPIGPIDLTTRSPECAENTPIGSGNATVSSISIPEKAQLRKSEFGAEVYRLEVPDVIVNVSAVQGRPLIVYRVHVPELERTIGTTTVLSHCTLGPRNLSISAASFEPERITQPKYMASLKVVYRGSKNGSNFAETQVSRNISVEVKNEPTEFELWESHLTTATENYCSADFR